MVDLEVYNGIAPNISLRKLSIKVGLVRRPKRSNFGKFGHASFTVVPDRELIRASDRGLDGRAGCLGPVEQDEAVAKFLLRVRRHENNLRHLQVFNDAVAVIVDIMTFDNSIFKGILNYDLSSVTTLTLLSSTVTRVTL